MSARISPTAHYTGYVWYRNALSVPALRTRQGAAMYRVIHPIEWLYRTLTGGPSLEALLLARHRQIDDWLTEEIEAGRVQQVVEVAAGMSPRGLRFSRRYPKLVYVEADLAGMATRKRAALPSTATGHHVVTVDALADSGPHALATVCEPLLVATAGTAIITEGLINYFDKATVMGIWKRFSGLLRTFPYGIYLSDLHLRRETERYWAARAFRRLLGVAARGAIHFHFETADEARDALLAAGFSHAMLRHPKSDGAPVDLVRIVRATCT